jgi:DNA-binding response OmpR family regulator
LAVTRKTRVLVVDDETAITSKLAPFLERAGFIVEVAGDGETALRAVVSFAPDLIVLDVLMPKLDGREVCRRLRSAGNSTPILMLSQVGGPAERAMSLEEGADDYLNKPFEPTELVARLRVLLRRTRHGEPSLAAARRLACDHFVLDRVARKVMADGQEVALTPRSVALLDYLMTHPGELLRRERLLDAVWGWEYPVGTRVVDMRIAELRRALGDDAAAPRYIETVPGQGYMFIGQVEVVP